MQVNLSDLEVVNGKKSNIKAGEVTDAGKTYIVIVIDPSVNLGRRHRQNDGRRQLQRFQGVPAI